MEMRELNEAEIKMVSGAGVEQGAYAVGVAIGTAIANAVNAFMSNTPEHDIQVTTIGVRG